MDGGIMTGTASEVLNKTLFEIGGTPVSTATVVIVVGIILGAMIASALAQRAIARAFRYRGVDAEGTALATARLAHYGLLLIGFGIALQTVGIDLGALFAAGAIFAVGLGFAMQSIAQNFVSGVILLVERSIKPGDVVEVSEGVVKVIKMGIRATIVETRDGENLIVPNSALIQSTVKNYTFSDKFFRVRVQVGVVYSSDMKVVFETLNRVANDLTKEWAHTDREPQVIMTGFGDNSVNFDVAVWTNDPWMYRTAISRLHEVVWWGLKDQDIVIAFPQLDVHLDQPALDALKALAQAGGVSPKPTTSFSQST